MSSFRRLCSTRLPVQKRPIRLNRILPIAAAAPVRIITDQSLSRRDRSERRRFANRAEVFEGPFERRIQQFETEIDFGIGRSQWRGNAHDRLCQVYVLGTRSGCIQYPDLLDFQPSISA
jgi:hypothetical protein